MFIIDAVNKLNLCNIVHIQNFHMFTKTILEIELINVRNAIILSILRRGILSKRQSVVFVFSMTMRNALTNFGWCRNIKILSHVQSRVRIDESEK